MAPLKPRITVRAKVARKGRPTPTSHNTNEISPFPPSKKDKQRIKHSSFISKIEKSSASTRKRRRPSKKLIAKLDSLADALSGLDVVKDGTPADAAKMQRKILKSMKSRPGAMKRKEKLEKAERDRFNKNMAQMASSTNENAIDDRWAALKSHVENNMEIKSEFLKKEDMRSL